MFRAFFFLVTILVHQSQALLPPSRKAQPGEAPYMVRISDTRKYCGGTIIRNNIILTAGHCADSKYPDQVTVRAGTNFVYYPDKGQTVGVEQLVPHENFRVGDNGVQAFNDIGLIKLSKPLEFNSQVQAIDWANVSLKHDAHMFGFGYTNDNEDPADYLRTINVTFIEEEKCKGMLEKTITKSVKEPYELCAEKCACNGDSGSPLIQMFNGVPKIVGIASWLADDLYGCNTPPAVFLKVAEFEDWINEKLKDLEVDNVVEERSKKQEETTTPQAHSYFTQTPPTYTHYRTHRYHFRESFHY